nr:hypothetical protein [Halorhabdus salina]
MRYRNALLFVVLAAVWGSVFAAIKARLATFPPVLFAAIHYNIAGMSFGAALSFATGRVLTRWLDPICRSRR